MTTSYGYNATDTLATTLRRLARELTLPAALTAHFAELDALKANADTAAKGDPFADAMAAARADKLTDKVLAAIDLHPRRVEVLKALHDDEARRTGSVIASVRDELVDVIRASIYTPAIKALEALADEVAPTATTDELIRAGRPEMATQLVQAETHASEVRRAHTLARDILNDRTLRNIATMYRDAETARKAIDHANPWGVPSILSAIQAGGCPHLPSRRELAGALAARPAQTEAEAARARAHFGDAPAFFPGA